MQIKSNTMLNESINSAWKETKNKKQVSHNSNLLLTILAALLELFKCLIMNSV